MPAERAELHTDVDPGHVDAAHVLQARKLEERVLLVLEVAKVPRVVSVQLLLLSELLLLLSTEATAINICVQISRILDSTLVTNLVVHDVPVLFLNLAEYLLILRPVDIVVALLDVFRHVLELFECVSRLILVERCTLRKFLQGLEASR